VEKVERSRRKAFVQGLMSEPLTGAEDELMDLTSGGGDMTELGKDQPLGKPGTG
jgi:hypothetical protein